MRDPKEIERERQRALRELARVRVEHAQTLELLKRWMDRSAIPKGRANPAHCRLCDEPDVVCNRVEWRAACPHHVTAEWIKHMHTRLHAAVTVADLKPIAPPADPDPATLTD